MRLCYKLMALCLALLLSFSVLPVFAQTPQSVPVILGGQVVATGVLENDRTLVPIRFISEALGYKVEWDEENLKVHVFGEKSFHVLQIDNHVAEVHKNGMMMESVLDVAPKLIQDRTYVPLRYITESLGCGVLWHSDERAVYLSMPTVFTLEKHDVSMVHFTKEDAQNAFSGAYDVLHGADGIERHVYLRPESGNMIVFGFYENQLFEFFTNDSSVLTNGETLSPAVAEKLGDSGYVFYDELQNNTPVALYVSLGGKYYNPYKSETLHDAIMSQEAKMVFYLTNSLRRKAGKADLVYSDALAMADADHVADMAKNHYLAHEDLNGNGIEDRIQSQPAYAKYRLLGEILAKMPNAYYACYGWLNSETHREAMLGGAYMYTGICVDGNVGENLYYAQVLIKLK